MTNLQEFLNQNVVAGMTKKVPISDRLRDKDGNLLMAEIKTIDPKEIRVLRKKYTKYNKKGVPEVNSEALNEEIVIEYTVDPNFKDAESIKATGCLSPVQYMNKVLLSGEIEILNKAILEFSGYSTSIDDLAGEVKN